MHRISCYWRRLECSPLLHASRMGWDNVFQLFYCRFQLHTILIPIFERYCRNNSDENRRAQNFKWLWKCWMCARAGALVLGDFRLYYIPHNIRQIRLEVCDENLHKLHPIATAHQQVHFKSHIPSYYFRPSLSLSFTLCLRCSLLLLFCLLPPPPGTTSVHPPTMPIWFID